MKIQGAELQAKMQKEIANAPLYATTAVKALPSVLLGCLLNILDGVSCKFSVFLFLFSWIFLVSALIRWFFGPPSIFARSFLETDV